MPLSSPSGVHADRLDRTVYLRGVAADLEELGLWRLNCRSRTPVEEDVGGRRWRSGWFDWTMCTNPECVPDLDGFSNQDINNMGPC